MKAVKEFCRFASSYSHYSIIQRQAAEYLVSWIREPDLGRVIDLGCGDGEIYRQIKRRGFRVETFFAVDLAESMLTLHPKEAMVRSLLGDFNDYDFLESLKEFSPKTLLSSSALQWSRDLEMTLDSLSHLGCRSYFSIFTDGTFSTLHRLAGIDSPIRSFEETEASLNAHYRIRRLERVHYRLHFETTREMFRYIKHSGVSGGEARLGYREAKELMECYPLDYLEFELLFAELEPKNSLSRS
ncbi:class I SAM-dependent methyltransferase [Nitratifractor sp.]